MNLIKSFIYSAFIALIGFVSAETIDISEYTKNLFTVNLTETSTYEVEGSTCTVNMVYIEGTCTGSYFNGELVFKDSSVVTKTYKDGTVASKSRYFIEGSDKDENSGHIHIEDNLIGKDNEGHDIVSPIIITDIQDLAWLQVAHVIGIIEETDNGKTITYKWNENNTTPKPFPEVHIPDMTIDYPRKVFTVDVIPGGLGFDIFPGVNGTFAGKYGFTCAANTLHEDDNAIKFQGEGLDYFVDIRHKYPDQIQFLSARYIIEGVDDEGETHKIYVENIGVDENGENLNVRTEPIFITDNPKWAWLETAPIYGNMTMEPSIQIFFYTLDGVIPEPEEPEPEETEVPAEPEEPENPNAVSIKNYTKKLFTVTLNETKNYEVEGSTCAVNMIYIEGSCAGDYFNGDLVFQDSAVVVKTYKDGKVESKSRYFIEGTDKDENAGHLHIEDNLIGKDSKGRDIVSPIIITDIQDLAWLQIAQVIGIVEETDDGKTITYMWNENDTTPKPFPEVHIPDMTIDYPRKVFTVDVIPGGLGFNIFPGVNGTFAGKYGFNCAANTLNETDSAIKFHGEGLDYFVDIRHNYPDQIQFLSARYIIEGIDDEGESHRIYVENIGVDENGENLNVRTNPIFITDNPKWAWLETAPIYGNMTMEPSIQIFFYTLDGVIPEPEEPEPEETEIPEETEVPEEPEEPEDPNAVSIKNYTKKLFTVTLNETKNYEVEGNTCNVNMIYIEGSCAGDYFNGDLVFQDSAVVVKTYKDGKVESKSRYFIEGTDKDENAGHLHIEDNLIGKDSKGRDIVSPIIITDIQDLAWLQIAQVIGIVEETDDGKTITYMWNENDTTPKPFPEVHIPDMTIDYPRKVFAVDVIPGGLGFNIFPGVNGTFAGKYGFNCAANTLNETDSAIKFQGEGLDYFVDIRHNYPDQIQFLSARYIIEGVDDEGETHKIYVENIGVDENGENLNVRTNPIFITDNPKWAWLETAPIYGNMTMEPSIQIFFYTLDGVIPEPEEPEEPEDPNAVSIKNYTKKLFTVNLNETKNYEVEGNTCNVNMVYIEGSCAGDYFNGDLVFQDSAVVTKTYKDGKVESKSRYFIEGTDKDENAGHLHIEDNLIGKDSKGRDIVSPIIITDIQDLAWLQVAQVIGIIEETDNGKTITYMWNENDTTPKPFPEVHIPDMTIDYPRKVFAVDVIPGGLGFNIFPGVNGTFAGKYGFNCAANTLNETDSAIKFQGEGLDYFVDIRHNYPDQIQFLSARYIIEGVDDEGETHKIYVENIGVDENGENLNVRTNPIFITDNPKWAWLETAPIYGNMTMEPTIQIFFYTLDGVIPEDPEPKPTETTVIAQTTETPEPTTTTTTTTTITTTKTTKTKKTKTTKTKKTKTTKTKKTKTKKTKTTKTKKTKTTKTKKPKTQ